MMLKKIKDVFRRFHDNSNELVAHLEGTGFSEENPSHNLEIVFDGDNITLFEDYYVHAEGYSRRRKIGEVKEIKLLKLLHNNQFVLEVNYKEKIEDWKHY